MKRLLFLLLILPIAGLAQNLKTSINLNVRHHKLTQDAISSVMDEFVDSLRAHGGGGGSIDALERIDFTNPSGILFNGYPQFAPSIVRGQLYLSLPSYSFILVDSLAGTDWLSISSSGTQLNISGGANSSISLHTPNNVNVQSDPGDGNVIFGNIGGTVGFKTASAVGYTTASLSGQIAMTSCNTAVLNFGSTAAGAKADLTLGLSDAEVGDALTLGIPAGSIVANGVFYTWVSSSNQITVRFVNTQLSGNLDPPSGTFKVCYTKIP